MATKGRKKLKILIEDVSEEEGIDIKELKLILRSMVKCIKRVFDDYANGKTIRIPRFGSFMYNTHFAKYYVVGRALGMHKKHILNFEKYVSLYTDEKIEINGTSEVQPTGDSK